MRPCRCLALLVTAVALAATRGLSQPISPSEQSAGATAQWAERMGATGDFVTASQYADIASAEAAKGANAGLTSWTRTLADDLHRLKDAAQAVQDARAKLAADPADPDANAAMGRFYCFSAGDWDRGLAHLANGSDAALKAAAIYDRRAAGQADGKAAAFAGDKWLTLSASEQDEAVKRAMRQRAEWCYEAAAARLGESERETVQLRAEGLRKANLLPGLRAEFFVGTRFDRRVLTRIDPNVDFSWGFGQPAPLVPQAYFSTRWSGWIKAPTPGRYVLSITGDDCVRVWLDGRMVIGRWTYFRPDAERASVQLSGAPQEIRIEHYQVEGEAYVRLAWVPPGQNHTQVVPSEVLFHEPFLPAGWMVQRAEQSPDGDVVLRAADADLFGPELRYQEGDHNAGLLAHWTRREAVATWKFSAAAGDYAVELTYAVAPSAAGSDFTVGVRTATVTGRAESTGGDDRYRVVRLGKIHLAAGEQHLAVKPVTVPHGTVMNLRQIVLRRAVDAVAGNVPVPPVPVPPVPANAVPAERRTPFRTPEAVLKALPSDLIPATTRELTEARISVMNDALNERVKGKDALFTLRVLDVAVDPRPPAGYRVIIKAADSRVGRMIVAGSAYFDDDAKRRLAMLKAGDVVTVRGTLFRPQFLRDPAGLKLLVDLDHCQLIRTSE